MADFVIRVPWLQLDLPKITSHVLDRAMELTLEDLRNDTEFYDPETRTAQNQLMSEITANINQYNAGVSDKDRIAFDGKYTGGSPRYPMHLRDCWTGWNFVNTEIQLFNHAPAARFLFYGNSPGGEGGPVVPRFANYMTFYYRRLPNFQSKWCRAKTVRSVEESGRKAEFRDFIFKTIQRNIQIAIEEFTLPPARGGRAFHILADADRRLIAQEIQYLNRSIRKGQSRWQSYAKRRQDVKPSSDEWDRLSERVGSEYEELYEKRRRRKNMLDRLKRHQKATAAAAEERRQARQSIQQKTTEKVKTQKKPAYKPPETVKEKIEQKVEERQGPPPRSKAERLRDIRGLYGGPKELKVEKTEKYSKPGKGSRRKKKR